jgi:hypothetical protein
MILPPGAVALDVTLIWGPNSEPDLAGYRLYLRRDGEFFDYDHPEWEGPEPTCTVRDLDEDTHYYFVVRAFDTAGNESGDSNELGLPVLLLSPFEGSDPADAPTFQWTPGPCDLYMFCTLFSYPEVGYYPACVLTEDDFLVMPPAWWNRIEEGPLCYWDVHGFNTKTGHYESPHYTEFTKIE